MTQSPNKKSADEYMKDILSYINQNPSGMTITDIAEGIDSSRVTVGKYIAILLERDEVFYKKIGAYKLYFNSKSEFIPRDMVYSYFKGFLSGIDEVIDDKSKLKEIGSVIAGHMDFPYGSKFPEKVLPKNNKNSVNEFLKYFGQIIPFVQFLYRNKINVETNVDKKAKRALYRISNLGNLEKFMQNHFYIMTGVIEKSILKKLNMNARCQIEKIDIENRLLEFSIEFID
ncbi:MAG: hypothetical protein EU547_03315 [Promethearchaeota archaeon]|nr:MAG: hypothetical protein EU547_03315 [Candidatus Lokiarchaeota archaeon]